jgi:hypothetical protein
MFHYFVWVCHSLFIHSPVNGYREVSSFSLLWLKLLWASLYTAFGGYVVSFLIAVELLSFSAHACLTLRKSQILELGMWLSDRAFPYHVRSGFHPQYHKRKTERDKQRERKGIILVDPTLTFPSWLLMLSTFLCLFPLQTLFCVCFAYNKVVKVFFFFSP